MNYTSNLFVNSWDGVLTWRLNNNLRSDDIELMQYTGLKDKNGKEIYEGDIIKFKDLNYDVCWNEGMAGFRVRSQKGIAYITGDLFKAVDEGCKVIGNIYENPDLLK